MQSIMSPQTAIELAKDPNTPPEVLYNLTYHKDYRVRYKVANNPNVPVSALEKFVEDALDPNIRFVGTIPYDIAMNPNTPGFLLEKLAELAESNYGIIVNFIAENPSTPERIKNYLMAKVYILDFPRVYINDYPFDV